MSSGQLKFALIGILIVGLAAGLMIFGTPLLSKLDNMLAKDETPVESVQIDFDNATFSTGGGEGEGESDSSKGE